jgi:hypothetical protein
MSNTPSRTPLHRLPRMGPEPPRRRASRSALPITRRKPSAIWCIVELPEVGATSCKAGDEACAVVESVKAASDIYSPIAGTVTAGNAALGR